MTFIHISLFHSRLLFRMEYRYRWIRTLLKSTSLAIGVLSTGTQLTAIRI